MFHSTAAVRNGLTKQTKLSQDWQAIAARAPDDTTAGIDEFLRLNRRPGHIAIAFFEWPAFYAWRAGGVRS